MRRHFFAYLILLLISLGANAQIEPQQLRPWAFLQADAFAGTVDLLDEIKAHIETIELSELALRFPYNRRQHFGGWLHSYRPGSCVDTRNEVLIRDSEQPVKYRDRTQCKVERGLWDDPYTGEEYKRATTMQVDHVVPLKHTWLMGGHQWPPSRRCHFANFLNNEFHLISVNGIENMRKGDRSPERYLPPNAEHHCQYVNNWLKIKAIWGLKATPAELNTVETILNDCPRSFRKIAGYLLTQQQRSSEEPVEACNKFGSSQSPKIELQSEIDYFENTDENTIH